MHQAPACLQIIDTHEQPILFICQKLQPVEQNYLITENDNKITGPQCKGYLKLGIKLFLLQVGGFYTAVWQWESVAMLLFCTFTLICVFAIAR